jgi:hypothetical protein
VADARRRRHLAGSPQRPAAGERVLRRAPPGDGDRPARPAGVYFGTNSGALYASADEGDSWAEVAAHLPPILSVETMVVEG